MKLAPSVLPRQLAGEMRVTPVSFVEKLEKLGYPAGALRPERLGWMFERQSADSNRGRAQTKARDPRSSRPHSARVTGAACLLEAIASDRISAGNSVALSGVGAGQRNAASAPAQAHSQNQGLLSGEVRGGDRSASDSHRQS